MKGMIFAAGIGSRLRPITDSMPKALVKIGDEPMLGRTIKRMVAAGIREIVVNVHHFPDMIKAYLSDNSFGAEIHISDESDCLLDTGGGILRSRQWLEGSEEIVIHNADILTDFSIEEMLDAHTESENLATLLVSDRQSSRRLLFDEDMRLKGWKNMGTGETKPPTLNSDYSKALAFGGVHIVSPKIFKLLENYSDNAVFSIIPFYIHACEKARIAGFVPTQPYSWFDIGKHTTLEQARKWAMSAPTPTTT